jgi:excisionase family DNA binding protein
MPNIWLDELISNGEIDASLIKYKKPQATPSLTDNMLTAREVAVYLRLMVTTVWKLAASGELPGFKIGKSWRFDGREVMSRIASAKQKAKPVD